MKPNGAICFLLAGFSLASSRYEPLSSSVRFLAQVSAFVVALIGSLTLSDISPPPRRWHRSDAVRLFPYTAPAHLPERMASCSALGFLLMGVSLLMLIDMPSRRWRGAHRDYRTDRALCAVGSHLRIQQSHLIGRTFQSMAVITALTFLLLTVGTLLTCSDQGLKRTFVDGFPTTPTLFASISSSRRWSSPKRARGTFCSCSAKSSTARRSDTSTSRCAVSDRRARGF